MNCKSGLQKVSYDGTEYVKELAYNAKGQRLLLVLGNDTMTRYAYDDKTFRLKRQRTEKYTYTKNYQTITYAPQSGTNKEDTGYDYDLVGNILKILNRTTDCGITGSTLGADKLDREFSYDPLYRLRTATGRESDTQNQNDYLYSDAPIPGNPNAGNVRAYTRKYEYDEIGNVNQMKHVASGNTFTRNFNYFSGVNTLEKIETGSSSLIQNFTYDTAGNQLTAGTNRHYEWTAGNNLLIYKNQAGSADPTIYAQYEYEGMNRVSKMVRTGTAQNPTYERTIYIDGIFEYHILENGTTYEKNYVHIMDASASSAQASRIAMVRVGTSFPDDISESTVYILENQISSSTARLKTDGSVIDREEYYPFGASSLRTFTKKRYQYVGKEKDAESGLYYYGARYYAPWLCRFISVDPMKEERAWLTPYNYVQNNPINLTDPTGALDDGGGGGDPVKKGDTFVGDDGKTYTASIDEVVITGTKSPTATENQETKTEAAENLSPTSFTYTLDYEANSSSIPFVESYRLAAGTFTNVLETGEVSNFVEGDTGGGFNITLRVPKIYPHNRDNPTYTTYTGTGSDLESMTWEKEESLGQAFIDGFNVGWKVGLSTAIQEELATAILFKRFNLSKPKSFEGADPELLRMFFNKKGWKVNPTNNRGFKAINPENSSDVFHIIRGNASKLKPGSNIPKVKQGDYLKRPYMDSWPKRTPLK